MICTIIVVISSGCVESDQNKSFSDDGIAKFGGVDVLETDQSLVDDPSSAHLVTESARQGGILVIDTFSCGIPDPAIDAAVLSKASKGSLELNLVSEIHAGLMMIEESDEIRLSTALLEGYSIADNNVVYEFSLKKRSEIQRRKPTESVGCQMELGEITSKIYLERTCYICSRSHRRCRCSSERLLKRSDRRRSCRRPPLHRTATRT